MSKKRITIKQYLDNPTAAAYEQMVEQMAKAIEADWIHGYNARAALRAIGIKRPKKATP